MGCREVYCVVISTRTEFRERLICDVFRIKTFDDVKLFKSDIRPNWMTEWVHLIEVVRFSSPKSDPIFYGKGCSKKLTQTATI